MLPLCYAAPFTVRIELDFVILGNAHDVRLRSEFEMVRNTRCHKKTKHSKVSINLPRRDQRNEGYDHEIKAHLHLINWQEA